MSNNISFEYDPLIFLRCHSKTDNDEADVKTQIWQAAFEPVKGSNIVATCGGCKVCFINASNGKVEKRYSSSDVRELFYALAWTVIENEDYEKFSIVAVGGGRGVIHFICPGTPRVICLHDMKIKRNLRINCLFFAKEYPRLLYCAINNGDIYISQLLHNNKCEILNKVSLSCEIFAISIYDCIKMLFVGTENGLKGLVLNTDVTSIDIHVREITKGDDRCTENSDKVVDSVEALSDKLLAVKYALRGVIYVCDIRSLPDNMDELDSVDIKPSFTLRWSDSDNYFMSISGSLEAGILTCGDDEGSIWIYDMNELKNGNSKLIQRKQLIKWPKLDDIYLTRSRKLDVYDTIIAKAAIHSSSKCIVAVTNNNLVCIWHRKKD